jgi:hypothetical protein
VRKLCLRALAALTVLSLGAVAQAADHGDGAAVGAVDGLADINDVFAWMNGDASRINLVMTVKPNADATTEFSDAVQYNFRLAAHPDYATTVLMPDQAPARRVRVTCTFDAAQTISCWVVDGTTTLDYVTGDASDPAGITSASGKVKVFAGLRNDPFFFNLAGFRVATSAVYDAVADGLTPDASGCFALDQATRTTLLGALTSGCAGPGSDAFNFFDKRDDANNADCPADDTYFINQGLSGNVLAISVQLDKTLVVDDANPVLGVWASTNM